MTAELFETAGGDQACDSDQAAVALGEICPFPDIAEENVVGEFDERRSEIADSTLCGCRIGQWRRSFRDGQSSYAA